MADSKPVMHTGIQILNSEHVFCAECLYKSCQADEHPCNKCAVDSSGMDATEYKPAGTPDEVL